MEQTFLRDTFDRKIDYLRLSVTDRCDFRCLYCMAEEMTFLPKKEVLSLEELIRVSDIFVQLGVKKIRVSGGEPLIRKDALLLLKQLGRLSSLEELCLTTNASQLEKTAKDIYQAGVKRINISLDSLKPERFRQLTRHGDLNVVLRGIDKALEQGFQGIKINAVLMQQYNIDEIIDLADFALKRGCDISFIEEMPLGEISSHSRAQEFISSAHVRNILSQKFDLKESTVTTGGPSKYWSVDGCKNKLGFISPHSENFCASCNRVRVTAEGKLLLCLGNEDSLDLKALIRSERNDDDIKQAIIAAMQYKPEKHEFNLDQPPQILRFMNATGG
ncbi:MAG: GTP 3',8-cyclase MoaA [Agarilytica sp.]